MGARGASDATGCMVGRIRSHDGALGRCGCRANRVPKPKAEHEAGLRPTGLFPYDYMVWMAIRKSQDTQRQWSLDIHGGRHSGAATFEARTRASIEVARHEGQHTFLVFLDCTKCYERAGHASAGDRAAACGM